MQTLIVEEGRTLGKKIRKIKKEIEYKNLDKETLLKKIKERYRDWEKNKKRTRKIQNR